MQFTSFGVRGRGREVGFCARPLCAYPWARVLVQGLADMRRNTQPHTTLNLVFLNSCTVCFMGFLLKKIILPDIS